MKLRIVPVGLSLAVAGAMLPAVSAEAGGRNYSTAWESAYIKWTGYVQIQASYSDGGRHARQGYQRFVREAGPSLDTGRLYTSAATSRYDTSVRSRTDSVWDSLGIGDRYTTHHYYGFIYF